MHMIRLGIKTKTLFNTPHCIEIVQKMRERGIPPDLGYLVHARITSLFEGDSPRVFSFDERSIHESEYTTVLGYTKKPADDLSADAQRFSDPIGWDTVDWSQFASKPLRLGFQRGQVFGFKVRVCPVVFDTMSGKEIDAFDVAKRRANGRYVNRSAVYQTWVTDRLSWCNGQRSVRVMGLRLEQSRSTVFFRQAVRDESGERRPLFFRHPDATLVGTLEVMNAELFQQTFMLGVGRQKAFGFGMLLLRRP